MLNAIRRLIQRYGFFKRAEDPQIALGLLCDNFPNHPFYTEEKRKNERLAQIARERDTLKNELAKAIRQKTKRSGIYAEIKALKTEEMRLESGK